MITSTLLCYCAIVPTYNSSISYSTNISSFLYCYFLYVYIIYNNSIYFLVLGCSCQKSGLHKPYNKFTWYWVLTSFMGYLNIPTLTEKIIFLVYVRQCPESYEMHTKVFRGTTYFQISGGKKEHIWEGETKHGKR